MVARAIDPIVSLTWKKLLPKAWPCINRPLAVIVPLALILPIVDKDTPEGVDPLAIDIVCVDINPLAVIEDAVVYPEAVNVNKKIDRLSKKLGSDF